MKVIRPTVVTEEILTDSSIVEDDYGVWASGTTYAEGDRVILAHRRWESVVDGANVGNDPTSTTGKWLDVGPTNRWAMFDRKVGTVSTAPTSIIVEMEPGRIDSIALLAVDAETITVEMTVDGTPIYSRTIPTNVAGRSIDNWYDWFFAPIGRRKTVVFESLPRYSNAVVTVTIDAIDDGVDVSVGALIIGNQFDLGKTETKPTIGITDFSRKEYDDFGDADLQERAWSKPMSCRTLVPASRVDAVQEQVAALRATPAVWTASDRFDALVIYGWCKEFEMEVEDPWSFASFSISGLT